MTMPFQGTSNQSSDSYGPLPPIQQTADTSEFDLLKLVRTLRKRLGVILGIMVGLTVLVMIAVFQMTPLYTAETLILIDQQKTQVVDMQAVMSGLSSDSSTVDSQIEILRSRSIARQVVEKNNLLEDPEFNSVLAPASIFRWLDPRVWIRSLFKNTTPEDEAFREEAIMNAVIGKVVGATSVGRVGLTYVMSVQFTSINPAKAARLANAVAETYVLDQLEAKFDATKQANDWLSKRLETLRAQVQDSERAAQLYRTQHGLQGTGTGGMTVNEQQLSELNAQLILARTDLAEKQAKYSRARQILSSGGSIDSVMDVVQSGTISALRAKQAELARQQADLSSKYGPRHPSIVNIEAQQRDIGRQIGAEVSRIIGSIQNEAAVAETRVDALDQSLEDLKNQSGMNNQAVVRLRELEREADANRTVYESFLNRFKETSQQDIQTADARVISKATIPVGPSKPRKGLIGAVTLLLSLGLGVGMALLMERLDSGVRTATEVEEILGLTHLVSIPQTPDEKGVGGKRVGPADYLLLKPLSAFSESMRSLRSAMALSNVDNPPKIILFTSALPNEGKTTTAVSFARAAAQAGLKTILIDCDLRHPSIHKALNFATPKQGLVEMLANHASFEEVHLVDGRSQLSFVPVAAGSANPPDILGSGQMKRLLMRLRSEYDLVVLDSAPVLPVSDSRVLSAFADKSVFVVRWAETPRDASISAIKELRNYHADIAGAVLTVVDTAKQAKYGYGDGGYYYRQYSRYYAN